MGERESLKQRRNAYYGSGKKQETPAPVEVKAEETEAESQCEHDDFSTANDTTNTDAGEK